MLTAIDLKNILALIGRASLTGTEAKGVAILMQKIEAEIAAHGTNGEMQQPTLAKEQTCPTNG